MVFGDFLNSQAKALDGRDGAYPDWNVKVPKPVADLQREMQYPKVPISQFFPE